MNYGDIRDPLNKIISQLQKISKNTCTCVAQTSAGTDSSIPAGFNAVRVTKTSVGGTVDITMSDATVYSLTAQNEVFEINFGQELPAISIASGGGGTWKWVAIT